MQVQNVKSRDPIADIARAMARFDCGQIPVCGERGRPVRVVADRDIVARLSEPRVES